MKFLKLKHSIISSWSISIVGVKVLLREFSLVMVVMLNKVGVSITHGSLKVLVEHSKNKIDANNMVGLYLGPIQEICIMSKITKSSHCFCFLLLNLLG